MTHKQIPWSAKWQTKVQKENRDYLNFL